MWELGNTSTRDGTSSLELDLAWGGGWAGSRRRGEKEKKRGPLVCRNLEEEGGRVDFTPRRLCPTLSYMIGSVIKVTKCL